MIRKKANIIVVFLSTLLIAVYSTGICLTYEILESPAYLFALIDVGDVGIPLLVSYEK